jgi:hypothetical protein
VGWVGACVAGVVAVLVLTSWPDLDGVSVRLVLASATMFGLVAALAARLLAGLPAARGPIDARIPPGSSTWPTSTSPTPAPMRFDGRTGPDR